MVPRTFPSTYSGSGQQQMVVHFLPSIAGLKKWSDYIPVKLSTGGKENSYDNNGFISVAVTTQVAGRVAFKDYVPVYVDNSATDAWKINSIGYIPYGYSGTGDATLVLDFLNASTLDSKINFTRASSGTYIDSTGTLQTAGNNVARFEYDALTSAAKGLLIEESRTNSVRNNTMVGAVAGTPGTLPTNWAVSGLGTLTQQVVGTGTLKGVTYIDIRFSGTTSTTQLSVRFEPSNGAAGTNGQTFSFSSWLALAAGSLTNITYVFCNANIYNASSGYLTTPTFSGFDGATPTSTLIRRSGTLTISSATAAFIQPQIGFTFASGASIDITIRIGLPQLELGGTSTSVIATTNAAVTRSADVANITTLSPWYNATTGTLYTEVLLSQPAAGGNQFLARFSDNSYNNAIANNVEAAGGTQISTASSGVFDGLASAAIVLSANTVTKIAGAYAANNIAISKDGGTVVTDTTATIPSGLTRLDIGSDHAGANRLKAGYIRRIAYYPTRLSNTTLQQITTL